MKVIIMALLSCFAISAYCQPPKEELKKVYEKVVTLKKSDMDVLVEAAKQWQRLVMYDQSKNSNQKVMAFQQLEQYLIGLQQRVKIDSIEVKYNHKK